MSLVDLINNSIKKVILINKKNSYIIILSSTPTRMKFKIPHCIVREMTVMLILFKISSNF